LRRACSRLSAAIRLAISLKGSGRKLPHAAKPYTVGAFADELGCQNQNGGPRVCERRGEQLVSHPQQDSYRRAERMGG
jgi:hypothetical protein